MPRTIDYLFTLMSPWAYFGFDRLHAIAARHGAAIRYRPVLLLNVFSETGGLPLAKRHPARQAYRLVELQRWRAIRGLPLVLKPAGVPFDATLADCITLAAVARGFSPEAYLRAAHRAIWVEQQNLADDNTLIRLLAETGLPADLLDLARSTAIRAEYEANRDWALATNVFGAPSYVLDGEIFWGQDRLDLLDAALASGRPPYSPEGDA
ncbi:MAG: 2-hydroxychromene-2-carboxylate isomerase [Beijerinckiaceae bacterium]|jgi:2-hydroxychromene-2-carboxylate isomerase|nr:2-hydroxychromene-2-carboxylate isomerase [Beijerinckiaceae bacterium]